VGLAFGVLALEVGTCLGVASCSGDGDDVQRAVELSVSAAVEPVTIVFAGGARDWGDGCHACEVHVGGESTGVGGVADEDRGGDRAAAELC
jgi:hypothetical protein